MKLKPLPSVRRIVPRDAPETVAQETVAQETVAPETIAPARPRPAHASDVQGVIDNATADRLYGWAWDASSPGARLKVELRLAGEVVANTIADFVRPDLAKNGIGDGCHAFEFPLIASWLERRNELTAVALGTDGTEFPIAMRIRRAEEGGPAAPAQILRAIEALAAEQQSIRAEFAALRDRAGQLPEAAAVAAVNAQQQELTRKVEQLELWLTRLDGHLGDASRTGGADARGRLDTWQAIMIAVLASATSAALAVTVARYLMTGGIGL